MQMEDPNEQPAPDEDETSTAADAPVGDDAGDDDGDDGDDTGGDD